MIEITPADSVVPIYLEPMSDKEIADYKKEKEKIKVAAEAKATAKAALLDRLGITADEAKLLLS